jgi:hypothetical protein
MHKLLSILILNIMLMACAAPTAPDFSGKWTAINQFDTEIKVIPKTRPYAYEAIKLDTSLSTMLERWAVDSKVGYIHTCDSDYSLPVSINSLKSATLKEAIKAVNSVYAKQGVAVVFNADGLLSLTCAPFKLVFPHP